jgi:branched-subunit amino acid transport protein
MESSQMWMVIFGGMLVTYATRLSFLVFVLPERLPSLLRRGLRYAAPAVLAAIILPSVVIPTANASASPIHPRLIAGALAALVAWRTRNTWITIAAGMGLLWAIELLLPAL